MLSFSVHAHAHVFLFKSHPFHRPSSFFERHFIKISRAATCICSPVRKWSGKCPTNVTSCSLADHVLRARSALRTSVSGARGRVCAVSAPGEQGCPGIWRRRVLAMAFQENELHYTNKSKPPVAASPWSFDPVPNSEQPAPWLVLRRYLSPSSGRKKTSTESSNKPLPGPVSLFRSPSLLLWLLPAGPQNEIHPGGILASRRQHEPIPLPAALSPSAPRTSDL